MEFLLGSGKRFFEFATKLGELMLVNLLTLLCSLPVITVGAAFTAMHRVLVDIYRDQENKLVKTYFKSFKENFSQATKLWLVYLVYFGILAVDYWAFKNLNNATISYVNILVPVLAFIGTLSLCWVFVLLSRYRLTMKDTLLYSMTRIIAFPLRSLGMAVTLLLPLLLTVYLPQFFILIPLLGIAVPGIICAWLYDGALKIMEDDSEKQEQEEENDE